MAKVLVYRNGRPQFEEVQEIVVPKEYLERELTEEEEKELDKALIFCTFMNEETGEVLLSNAINFSKKSLKAFVKTT